MWFEIEWIPCFQLFASVTFIFPTIPSVLFVNFDFTSSCFTLGGCLLLWIIYTVERADFILGLLISICRSVFITGNIFALLGLNVVTNVRQFSWSWSRWHVLNSFVLVLNQELLWGRFELFFLDKLFWLVSNLVLGVSYILFPHRSLWRRAKLYGIFFLYGVGGLM